MTAARFDSASSSDRTWTGYNGFGEITSSGASLGSFSASFSFQFDADSNRTRVTYGDGNYVTYGFDGLDRPTSVLRSGSTTLVSYTYNSRGSRATIGGNFATSYGYYNDGRLSTLTNTPLASSYSAQYGFSYNPASQITQQTRDNDAFTWTGPVNGTQSYSTNGLNQYTMAGFSHDANGNLTSDGSTTYVYDVENRLVSASGAKNVTLRYDPMGRLYETSGGPAGLTRFAYDGDALVQEFNSGGSLLRRYVHGVDAGDDPLVWFEGAGFTNSEQRLLRSDHQGSIVAVADATSSSILAVNTYDEYGVPGNLNQGRFQYTGQTWMPALALYYYKARMYSPALGRFMQTDPIGYKDDINLYTYVSVDPVSQNDPSGNAGVPCSGKPECIGALEGAGARTAYVGVRSEQVRAEYNSASSKLDKGDTAGRSSVKSAARATTPAEVRGVIEGIRPGVAATSDSGGTANRTNATATKGAKALGMVGKGSIVVVAVTGVAEVASSDNKPRAMSSVAGAVGGGWLGGEIGAGIGLLGGPVAPITSPLGGLIGSAVGGYFGHQAGGAAYDQLTQ